MKIRIHRLTRMLGLLGIAFLTSGFHPHVSQLEFEFMGKFISVGEGSNRFFSDPNDSNNPSPWNVAIVHGSVEYASSTHGSNYYTNLSGFTLAPSFWGSYTKGPNHAHHQDVGLYIATENDPLVPILHNKNVWSRRNDCKYTLNGSTADACFTQDFSQLAAGAECWCHTGNTLDVEKKVMVNWAPFLPSTIHDTNNPSFDYSFNFYSTANTSVNGPREAPPTNSYRDKTDRYYASYARVPAEAQPSGDSDGHMAIIQPNGWILETINTVFLSQLNDSSVSGENYPQDSQGSGRAIVTAMASYTDPEDNGTAFWNGRRASMVPNYGGLPRLDQLNTGEDIGHSLCAIIGTNALAREIVGPALALDSDHANTGQYTGKIPMGALLAIEYNQTNVDYINDKNNWQCETDNDAVPGRGEICLAQKIAKAALNYGIYITDRGGTNGINLCGERMEKIPNDPDIDADSDGNPDWDIDEDGVVENAGQVIDRVYREKKLSDDTVGVTTSFNLAADFNWIRDRLRVLLHKDGPNAGKPYEK